MSDYKLDGNYLRDRRGIKIGRIDGKYIRDGTSTIVGRIDDKYIRDSRSTKIAEFDGTYIRDKRGVKIGTIDDVHKSINGVGGISLVALWILFVRQVITKLKNCNSQFLKYLVKKLFRSNLKKEEEKQ